MTSRDFELRPFSSSELRVMARITTSKEASVVVDVRTDPESIASAVVQQYRERTPKSARLHERARKALPGGSTRAALHFDPYPTYMEGGNGSKVIDVDGNTYVDLLNNATSIVLGQSDPGMVSAVTQHLNHGTSHSAPTAAQVELCELIRDRVQSVDVVVLANSGTEADMIAVRLARAYSGRNLVAKFEGGYHGTSDLLMIGSPFIFSLSDSREVIQARPPGTSADLDSQIVLAPFNDIPAAEKMFAQYGHELAAVIVEPMLGGGGAIPAEPEFLQAIRRSCDQHQVLLILDEVMTFRFAYGGAQALYKITPDLTTFGKLIGGAIGGIGGIGGRNEIMRFLEPGFPGGVPHHGTFNGNPVIARAGVATLEELSAPVCDHMNTLGEQLRQGFQAALDASKIAGQVTGMCSILNIHLTADPEPIRNHRQVVQSRRDLLPILHLALLNRGFICQPRGMFALSAANSAAEIEAAIAALSDSLEQLRPWIARQAPELLR